MFSVTSTGMCWRPLWTAIVRPTISGTTIERRDQVLIGLRSFFACATCTFFVRCRSTNGPFLVERGIIDYLLGLPQRTLFLRRWMIMLSVRLLWRVFRPLVF